MSSQDTQATVIGKSYDLLKFLITGVLKSMPKDQKFHIGTRIQNHLSDVMELLLAAYYSGLSQEKREKLRSVNLKLEMLRHYIRLCYDLGYFDSRKLKTINEQINEIGRMTGGWLKSLK